MNNVYLSTERLHLRPVTAADLTAIHELHSLPETDEFNTLGIPENIEQIRAILDKWMAANNREHNRSYIFAVELTGKNIFTGLAGINPGKEKYRNAEVWFKFHPKYWNRGYATETLKKLIEFCFNDLKLHRIEAGCAIGNTGSIKVLEKAGMKREAHTRQLLPLSSGWSDNYGYAILSTD
jgi:[ribosomal protein S5]-alanine N-acetyltransferase